MRSRKKPVCLRGQVSFSYQGIACSLEAKAAYKLVRVGFSNSNRGTTDDAAILGVTVEKGASFFKQSFELKIKGDLIPEAVR